MRYILRKVVVVNARRVLAELVRFARNAHLLSSFGKATVLYVLFFLYITTILRNVIVSLDTSFNLMVYVPINVKDHKYMM